MNASSMAVNCLNEFHMISGSCSIVLLSISVLPFNMSSGFSTLLLATMVGNPINQIHAKVKCFIDIKYSVRRTQSVHRKCIMR